LKQASASIAERLGRGFDFHKGGKLREAEEAYQEILSDDANNINALHLLGVIMIQTKRLESGVALLDKVLAIKPDYADALNNRGLALIELNRPDEALASYDQALAARPDHAEALFNRGLVLKELRRLDEALAAYDKALGVRPNRAEAFFNRGLALQELKRLDEALASYDQALALRPNYPEALNNCGTVLSALKRLDEALAACDKALLIRPDYVEALNNRGNALQELSRVEEALAAYDQALALRPDYAEALYNRGNALKELARADEALIAYDQALALRPDYAEALNNRGLTLKELNRLDEALAAYDRALALRPDNVETLCSRGMVLQELKRLDEALAAYDQALALRPDYAEALNNRGTVLQELLRLDDALVAYDRALAVRPAYADARYNRALATLLIGDFPSGWSGYESRWDRAGAPERILTTPFPIWTGGNVSGKKIVVYDEQGLGDVIQFSRYLGLLVALGAQVTLLVRPTLLGLMRTLDQAVRVLAIYPAGESFDYQCALLSLPLAFGTTMQSIPADTPYLRAELERTRKWKNRLGEPGFKIGIAWQGNKTAKIDRGRSFALAQFLGVSQVPNVRLISLQRNEGVEQLLHLPRGMTIETLGDDYDAATDAFLDAAAVMESLDLIISSDTSIAHLAGALGRPVWVALKYVPDWRWLLDRSGSPWYPTMRLFRQRLPDDWRGVFSEIEAALLRR
jgi:tetratricopeptide (TPR) repeat protein